jgi:hypothetical protein
MSKRKKASAQRGAIAVDFHQTPHEKKVSEMHSALHSLSDKIRVPMPSDNGEKLLPAALRSAGMHATTAKAHIDALHAHFKAAGKAE